MSPNTHLTALPPGPRAARQAQRERPRDRPARPPVRERASNWLRGLPLWIHAVPYGALALLGAVLLVPGVVPNGPDCGVSYFAAPLSERESFIRISAAAFGLVAGLLLLSALLASAQRRVGRPGVPTIVSFLVLGAVALAAVISPHAPLAVPAQAVMFVAVLGVAWSAGAALGIPALAGVAAWAMLSGARPLRAAQIGAWCTLLLVLPWIMAATYLTVTPICLD
jgi:hypothetical protein